MKRGLLHHHVQAACWQPPHSANNVFIVSFHVHTVTFTAQLPRKNHRRIKTPQSTTMLSAGSVRPHSRRRRSVHSVILIRTQVNRNRHLNLFMLFKSWRVKLSRTSEKVVGSSHETTVWPLVRSSDIDSRWYSCTVRPGYSYELGTRSTPAFTF